jgi:hypothetical protein
VSEWKEEPRTNILVHAAIRRTIRWSWPGIEDEAPRKNWRSTDEKPR